MPSLRQLKVAWLVASVLSVAAVHAEDDGKRLFEPCAMCHGASGEGNRELGAPRIAGLPDWYVVKQLQAFVAGTRGAHADDTAGQPMRAAAAALRDEKAIDGVTAHLGTLRQHRRVHACRTLQTLQKYQVLALRSLRV